MAFALRILIALVLVAAAGGPDGSALAQSVNKPASDAKAKAAADAAKKKKAEEDAQRAYAAGSRAYESGKTEQAIQHLTAALRGGGLPSSQMARALYLRGLSYRKQGKPGLAISDLTSAVWLKNGLSGKDRADAIAKRSEAYREAGLNETGGTERVVANSADPAKPAAGSAKSSGSGGGLLPWLTGGSSSSAPAAAPKTAAAPQAAPAATPAWETATLSSAVSRSTTSKTRTASDLSAPMLPVGPVAAAPSQTAPASKPASNNNLFSAIGSLFSGSSSSSTAANAPETTASTGHVAAVSSWSESTEVMPAGSSSSAASNTRVAAVPQRSASPAAPQFEGKYRLQVAAVRSRDEARALANKLQADHGASLEGRTPSVDEAVIGAMGTFYRVRVGPFADAAQPRKLCPALKADGFDCLIISK